MIYYKFTQLKPIYYFCEIDYIFKTEKFKNVQNYGGIYQVSDLGRVKSFKCGKERMLKPGIGGTGYLNVGFSVDNKAKTYLVHKLVAIAFLEHIPCNFKLIVDHIDNDKLNNKENNLQLITQRKNTSKDRFRIKYSSDYIGVTWHKKSNRWRSVIYVDDKRKCLGYYKSEKEASEAYQKVLKELL